MQILIHFPNEGDPMVSWLKNVVQVDSAFKGQLVQSSEVDPLHYKQLESHELHTSELLKNPEGQLSIHWPKCKIVTPFGQA